MFEIQPVIEDITARYRANPFYFSDSKSSVDQNLLSYAHPEYLVGTLQSMWNVHQKIPSDASRVLDYGCGPGILRYLQREQEWDYVVDSYTRSKIGRARDNAYQHMFSCLNPGELLGFYPHSIQKCDIQLDPVQEEPYDVIVMTKVGLVASNRWIDNETGEREHIPTMLQSFVTAGLATEDTLFVSNENCVLYARDQFKIALIPQIGSGVVL